MILELILLQIETALLSLLGTAGGAAGAAGAAGAVGAAEGISSLGNLLGTGLGIGQLISSAIKKKQAARARPEDIDPMQLKFLQEAEAKRRSFMVGTEYQSALDELKRTTAGLTKGAVRMTGGAGGAAISAMLRGKQAIGEAYNKVLAQEASRAQFYDQFVSNLIDKISERKLFLQMHDYSTLQAKEAGQRKEGMENILAGLANITGEDVSGAKEAISNLLGKRTGTIGTELPLEQYPGSTPVPAVEPSLLPAFA